MPSVLGQLLPATTAALLALAAACARSTDTSPPADVAAGALSHLPATIELGGTRPATLRLPPRATASQRAPLLVLLHGFGSSGANHTRFFAVTEAARARGFRVVAPDGTLDGQGRRFWNATAACCDLEGRDPDDVGYVLALIDEAIAQAGVDPQRVHLLGHSNGGFLALRLAREHAGRINSATSVAGAGAAAGEAGAGRTRILQIHGSADALIHLEGGRFGAPYPPAPQTVERWAERNGCSQATRERGTLDLDESVPGDETRRSAHAACPAGAAAELWVMTGSGHVPRFGPDFARAVLDWMEPSLDTSAIPPVEPITVPAASGQAVDHSLSPAGPDLPESP